MKFFVLITALFLHSVSPAENLVFRAPRTLKSGGRDGMPFHLLRARTEARHKQRGVERCTDCSLAALERAGLSPGARAKIRSIRETEKFTDEIRKKRKQIVTSCRQVPTDDCQAVEKKAINEMQRWQPPPLPKILPFRFESEGVSNSSNSSSSSSSRSRSSKSSGYSRTESPRYQADDSSEFDGEAGSGVSSRTANGEEALDEEAADEQQHQQAFAEVSGIFDIIKDMFGSGTDITDPKNFEGGNQGSYFDFMYPLGTEYPWACPCDENAFKRFEAGEIQAVPCRNQVDMSAQGIVAACNPKNHKMNGAVRVAGVPFLLGSFDEK